MSCESDIGGSDEAKAPRKHKRKREDGSKIDKFESASLWYLSICTMENDSIDICKPEFLIGSSKEADLRISSSKLALVHCLIRYVANDFAPIWMIVDKNSSLGTFLNGQKMQPNQPMPLRDGDVIILSDPDTCSIQFSSNSTAPCKVSKTSMDDDDDDVIFVKEIKSSTASTAKFQSRNVIANSAWDASNINNAPIRDKTPLQLKNLLERLLTAGSESDLLIELSSFIGNFAAQVEARKQESNKKLEDNKKEFDESKKKVKELGDIIKGLNTQLDDLNKKLEERNEELDAIQRINRKTFVDLVESELRCSICCEIIFKSTLHIPCLHVFCEVCISVWILKKKQCPVCRMPSLKIVPLKILDSFIERFFSSIPDDHSRNLRALCEKDKSDATDQQTLTIIEGADNNMRRRQITFGQVVLLGSQHTIDLT